MAIPKWWEDRPAGDAMPQAAGFFVFKLGPCLKQNMRFKNQLNMNNMYDFVWQYDKFVYFFLYCG